MEYLANVHRCVGIVSFLTIVILSACTDTESYLSKNAATSDGGYIMSLIRADFTSEGKLGQFQEDFRQDRIDVQSCKEGTLVYLWSTNSEVLDGGIYALIRKNTQQIDYDFDTPTDCGSYRRLEIS